MARRRPLLLRLTLLLLLPRLPRAGPTRWAQRVPPEGRQAGGRSASSAAPIEGGWVTLFEGGMWWWKGGG